VAALQRWFARVWPAISLGGSGVDRGPAAGTAAGDLLPPAAAAAIAARLLSPAPPLSRAAGDSALGVHPGTTNAPQPALPGAHAAAHGAEIIYLFALAALLALLAFTLWREFRSALRPGMR
jgi:hypothetical protein